MISTYQRLKRRRDAGEIDGFTLIELLIVIVVLGILAAIVIFALGGITGKSTLAACQANGATIKTAMAAYSSLNPGDTPSQANLTGTTEGGPFIQTWPSASDYTFTIAAGVLSVKNTTPGTTYTTAQTYVGPLSCSDLPGGTPPGIGL